MLPTPHGPTEAPLPEGAEGTAVGAGRTPDTGALQQVVAHLADVPDGDEADTATEGAPGDAPGTAAPEQSVPTDEAVADEAVTVDAAPVPPVTEPEIGPVAAALSDTRHRIAGLNPAELLFVAQQRALVAELCPDPTDAEAVAALFDRVHAQWVQADDRPDLQPLADAFGVALGDLVCAHAPDLVWATCSDRYGTEIVLARAEPEVLVFPIAAIAQSWHDAGPGWFTRHLATVVRGVVPQLSVADA